MSRRANSSPGTPKESYKQLSWARHREICPGELIALLAHPRRVINSSPAFFKHEGLKLHVTILELLIMDLDFSFILISQLVVAG
jgi:hypothetical protein